MLCTTLARPQSTSVGMTLPEVLVAMVISTMIMVALQSTISLAIKGIPSSTSVVQRDVAAARVLRKIESEIETCTRILESSANALTLLVPDRDANGVVEKIRYEWSSVSKELTRKYNSESPIVLLTELTDFTVQTEKTNYPFASKGLMATQSLELLNSATISTPLEIIPNVSALLSRGESLIPASASGDVWRPTQVRLRLRRVSTSSGVDLSLLPSLADNTPASSRTSSDNLTIPGASLPANYSDGLVSFSTSNAPWVKSGVPMAVTIVKTASASGSTFAKENSGTNALSWLLGVWSRSSSTTLEYELYGRRGISGSDLSTNLAHFANIRLQCQSMTGRTPIYGSSNLLNNVADLSADYNLDFSATPLLADQDANGASDWQMLTGATIPGSDISAGKWTTSGSSISLVASNNIDTNTMVDITWRATQSSTSEGFVQMNCLRSGSNAYPLKLVLRRESDGLQILTLENGTSTPAAQVYVATALPQEAVTVRMLISQALHSVVLIINGVEHGNFPINSTSVSASLPAISLGSSAGNMEFDSFRVRIWKP